MWVYIKSPGNIWTVGFYSPNGVWHSEGDYSSEYDAAQRVHYLNGGSKRDD
jgi:hypothetical protein